MNNANSNNLQIDVFKKPENVSEDEWYALDFNDPLMTVC